MKLGLITITFCCIAAPLAAQDTTHGHMGAPPHHRAMGRGGYMDEMMPMMREMMAPMIGIMVYEPQLLLARKDSLKLTSDQVSKLTSIQNSSKAAHDTAGAEFKAHFDAVNQAFKTAAPDTVALRPHFDAAHAAMGKAHWAGLVAAAQARAVLTDAQRQKVDTWVAGMQQRMQQQRTM